MCWREAVSFVGNFALMKPVDPVNISGSSSLNWYAGFVMPDSSFIKNSSARWPRKSNRVGRSWRVFLPLRRMGSKPSIFTVLSRSSLVSEAVYNPEMVLYNLSMLQVLMSLLFSSLSFVRL